MLSNKTIINRYSSSVMYVSNILIYGFTGLYYCFIQLYLHGHTSLSATYIGFLLSMAQAVAIFAPPFWGVCADKAKYKKHVLLVLIIGASVFYSLVPKSNNFFWLCFTLAGTMFFLSSLGSILDVIGMEVATTSKKPYGLIRLMGMIGYGFVSFGLSFLIADNILIVFKMCIAICILCCICISFMPRIKGHSHAKKMDLSVLLKAKELLLLIGVLGTAQFAYGYYMNFFPSYLTHELCAPTWLWGANVLLTTLSEAPFFLKFDVLYKKFGISKIVPVVMFATIIRYLLLSIFTQFTAILFIGLITGFLSASLLYSVNYYVNESIIPELRASAQTLVYALGLGVPRMLSGLLGGIMTDAIGTNYSLAVCSLVTLSGLSLYFIFYNKNRLFKTNNI